jgi:hypothetical protein
MNRCNKAGHEIYRMPLHLLLLSDTLALVQIMVSIRVPRPRVPYKPIVGNREEAFAK